MPIKHAVHWYQQLPIMTALGPIAGATIGYFVSKRRDRLERDARQRTVGGALLAEVRRIRTVLGGEARDHRAPDPIFYGLTFEPPRVHPWLERVIVDGAEISPEVVTDFMALERELGHFGTLVGQWREATAVSSAVSATPTRVAAIVGGGSASVAVPPAGALGGAERSRDRARTLYDECVATQRMAVKLLDRLESTLTPVVGRAAAASASPSYSPSSYAAAPSHAAAGAGAAGARWRSVKTRVRRAGATVLADFGLGDGWPEESTTASSPERKSGEG